MPRSSINVEVASSYLQYSDFLQRYDCDPSNDATTMPSQGPPSLSSMHAWEKHHRRWVGEEIACCCWDEGCWGLLPFNCAPPCNTAGGWWKILTAAAAGARGAGSCFPSFNRVLPCITAGEWAGSLLSAAGRRGAGATLIRPLTFPLSTSSEGRDLHLI